MRDFLNRLCKCAVKKATRAGHAIPIINFTWPNTLFELKYIKEILYGYLKFMYKHDDSYKVESTHVKTSVLCKQDLVKISFYMITEGNI